LKTFNKRVLKTGKEFENPASDGPVSRLGIESLFPGPIPERRRKKIKTQTAP
jgi:hypothetical protein